MKYAMPPGKILVRKTPEEDNSSALLIPDKVRKKPTTGIVEGVGEGITFVKVGDKIAFNQYAGMHLEDGSEGLEESNLIVLENDEILARIE